MKKCYIFENVWKLSRNKDERNEESQCLTHSAVQRRGAWTHVFTEQFLLGNSITILISWWCSVKLGRKTKKKMMEEIHVCMCRARVYRCVHAHSHGVGNKKIPPRDVSRGEEEPVQPRVHWVVSVTCALVTVTGGRWHKGQITVYTASRGVGQATPTSPGRRAQNQPLLHPQHSHPLCTHRTWCSVSQDTLDIWVL